MNKKLPMLNLSFLSILIPGLGQFCTGKRYRGVSILLGFLVILGMIAWYGNPYLYFIPVLIWLWNIWDAILISRKNHPLTAIIPILFGVGSAFVIGLDVVGVDFSKADINRAISIMRPMFNPDFIQKKSESSGAWVEIYVPCLTGKSVSGQNEIDGKKVTIVPTCAGVGDLVTVKGTGFWPDTDTQIWWEDPSGSVMMVGKGESSMLIAHADANGGFSATFKVPSTALLAIVDVNVSPPHRVILNQTRLLGGIEISYVGKRVLQGALETLGMALMATAFAIIFAVPISFLAARNLMSANKITYGIYFIVRTLLNILRSIESLIIAIVFVVIVGLGPFAGVLALAVHSIAALAKLYSEVIEGIDPGPIEAVRATGASWVQIVRYAVVPQIIPPFTSFTIYRWDINVRSATIIGFVGGGGIGFLLIELIRINDFRGVSALFIAIAFVVIVMDYVSAKIREKLI
jgi:phosphonate transport system permease protein